MPNHVAELIKQGRALEPTDRSRLVDELLASLNEPVAELASDWNAAIEQRLADYDQGRVEALDAQDVFAKARQIAK